MNKWNTLATEHEFRVFARDLNVEVSIHAIGQDGRPSVHVFTAKREDEPIVVYMNGRIVVNVA